MRRDPRRRHDGGELQPCVRCGAPKSPGQGRRYCDDCRELATWRRTRKYHARNVKQRQPCQRCGGRKPDGHGRRYCDACLAAAPRMCKECGEVEVQIPFLKCDACKRARLERERIANRNRSRERRRRQRAAGKGARPKTKAARKVDNESRRIKRRELRAAQGKPFPPPLSQEEYERRYGNGYGRAPTVKVDALLPLLQNVHDFEALAEAAQVDQSAIYRIINGHRSSLSVRAADRLCVALDVPFSLIFQESA